MTPDFALLITWTCYGTWLPGDERGHVSRTFDAQTGYSPKRNTAGTDYATGDPGTRLRARTLQQHPTVWLTTDHAVCVAEALVVAARARGWFIPRVAVMANHVHVVVFDCPADGSSVRRALKGVTQAALSELVGESRRWWTHAGSDRYKNDARAVENAVNYVAGQVGKLAEVVDMVASQVVR